MTRHLQRATAATALVAALLTSGCSDVPVIGPVYDTIKPYLSVLNPVLAPIKGMLGMSEPEDPVAAPAPRARPLRARNEAASQASNASGSVKPAEAQLTEEQFAKAVARNKEFDRLRTTGLMQLYGGETRMAIESFEQAAKLRPEDAHIHELIQLAKNPPRVSRGENSGLMPTVPGGFQP